MKPYIVAAVDIGTHSIKMVIGRISEAGDLEIIGSAEESSAGVRKGVIVNAEETAKRVALAKHKMEQMSPVPIQDVMVNIGGSHVFITPSHGIVAVSRADGSISQEDVDRVLQAAQALSLDSNKEVLDPVPREFIVDGVGGLKEVIGMRGVRLEVNVMAVCAFSPYIKNLSDAVLGADMGILDIVPSPLAAAEAVITPQQKELGVALIDMGAGTTSLAVYEEGDLLHTIIFPVGSENITNDIAIGLRTEPHIAEQIKLKFGSVSTKGRKMQKISLPDGSHLSFSQKFLSHVIEARVKEIFQLVNKELKRIGKQGMLPGGVILAGGGAKLPYLVEAAKKELKLSVKLGSPYGMIGHPDDISFLGTLGLLRKGMEAQKYRPPSIGNQELMRKIKKIFKMFIP